jgi:hypothetical protein
MERKIVATTTATSTPPSILSPTTSYKFILLLLLLFLFYHSITISSAVKITPVSKNDGDDSIDGNIDASQQDVGNVYKFNNLRESTCTYTPDRNKTSQPQRKQQIDNDIDIIIHNNNVNTKAVDIENIVMQNTNALAGSPLQNNGTISIFDGNNNNANSDGGGNSSSLTGPPGIDPSDVCRGDTVKLMTGNGNCVSYDPSRSNAYIGNKFLNCVEFVIQRNELPNAQHAIRNGYYIEFYTYLHEDIENSNPNTCFYPRNNLLYRPKIMPVSISKIISHQNECSWRIGLVDTNAGRNDKIAYGAPVDLLNGRLGSVDGCVLVDELVICKGSAACINHPETNGVCEWINNVNNLNGGKFYPIDTVFYLKLVKRSQALIDGTELCF